MTGLPRSREGALVNNPPTGFPLFFDQRKPRVVTADPWAFLRHLIDEQLANSTKGRATALVDQAFDFHEAATNPHLGSRPLLHYYSFLNLIKAALLYWGVPIPANAKHGIADPRANTKTKVRLSGQKVKTFARTQKHDRVFAEFVDFLGGEAMKIHEYKVVDILEQIPFIHRTYSQATRKDSKLVAIQEIEVLHSGAEYWARIRLRRNAPGVRQALSQVRSRQRFTRVFRQVTSSGEDEIWFESNVEQGRTSGVDRAIRDLALAVRSTGISALLSAKGGYRYYISTIATRIPLPHLAVPYAVMFYLGSVTRYQPDVFHKIIEGKYAWVVSEFLAACPRQFLYLLASEMAEVDVVRPFAAFD